MNLEHELGTSYDNKMKIASFNIVSHLDNRLKR